MRDAFIFDAVRTPRGRGKESGSLHGVKALDLLTPLFHTLKNRHDLDTSQVDDVLLGCVTPIGEQGANIAGQRRFMPDGMSICPGCRSTGFVHLVWMQ